MKRAIAEKAPASAKPVIPTQMILKGDEREGIDSGICSGH